MVYPTFGENCKEIAQFVCGFSWLDRNYFEDHDCLKLKFIVKRDGSFKEVLSCVEKDQIHRGALT